VAGEQGVEVLNVNDLNSGWTTLPPPKHHAYGMCVLEGKIWVTGCTSASARSKSCITYDLFETKSSWKLTQSLPSTLYGHIALVIDNRMHLIGGSTASPLKQLKVFDPIENQFQDLAPMQMARCHFTAVKVETGRKRILVFGGINDKYTHSRTCEQYDVVANKWESIPDVPMISIQPENSACAVGNKVYFASGGSLTLEYDIENKKWTNIVSPQSGLTVGLVASLSW